MDKRLKFNIDSYEVLQNDPYIMILEAFIVSDGLNKQKTIFTVESMERAMPTLANKPLICIFDKYKEDFKAHANSDYETRYTQKCVGNIPESNDAQIVQYEGKNFVKCKVLIWKEYAPQVAERFAKNDKASISMEIYINKYHMNNDGYPVIDDYRYLGISLLGEGINPAITHANVKVIKFSEPIYADIINKFNKLYYTLTQHYEVPEIIKYNATESLSMPQKNIQLIKFAKKLSEAEHMTYDEVHNLYGKISNIRKEDNILFYGGEDAREWCKHIIENFEGGASALNKAEETITNDVINDVVEPDNNEEILDGSIGNDTVTTEAVNFSEDEGEVITEPDNATETEPEGDNETKPEEEYATNMDIYSMLADKVEEEKDDYGWYKYMLVDFDESFAYAWSFDKTSYIKLSYSIDGEVPVVNMEEQPEVYLLSKWVDKPEANYKSRYSEMAEKFVELRSEITKAIQIAENIKIEKAEVETEKSNLGVQYSELQGAVETLTKDNDELIKFKEKTLKEKRQNHANNLYSQYSDYLSEQEVEELNAKLYSYPEFVDFEKEVKSIVLPKVEALLDATKNKGDDKYSQDKKTIKTSILSTLTSDKDSRKASPRTQAELLMQTFGDTRKD